MSNLRKNLKFKAGIQAEFKIRQMFPSCQFAIWREQILTSVDFGTSMGEFGAKDLVEDQIFTVDQDPNVENRKFKLGKFLGKFVWCQKAVLNFTLFSQVEGGSVEFMKPFISTKMFNALWSWRN